MCAHVILLLVVGAVSSALACPVYLTLATNSLTLKESALVVNWGPDCAKVPTRIRVYGENPYLCETPSLEEIVPASRSFGRIETKIELGQLILPRKWNEVAQSEEIRRNNESDTNCLNFYILSFNQSNHVTNFNCLKINPQWMSKSKELWLFPLKQLLIPGTHCSGCYMTRSNVRRKNLRDLGIFRQRFSVWEQLVLGVRYLDFSVGYFRSFHEILDIKGRFWVFSGNHEVTPIFPILEDIRRFVELSQEIVIINFRDFPYGFHENSGAHEIFKQLLRNTFGHFAVVNRKNGKRSSDFTIQQLRSASKYVLILYNDTDLSVVREMNETILWPEWKHIKTDESAVKNLSAELSTNPDDDDGWILDIDYGESSLEKIGDINSRIALALNGLWGTKANVIPLDFVFSTDLPDISQHVNQQKALTKRNFVVIDL